MNRTDSSDIARRLRLRAERVHVRRGDTPESRLLEEAADALDRAVVLPAGSEAAFQWLISERSYQVGKYGYESDDAHAAEPFIQGTWWHDSMVNRLQRTVVLEPPSPLGMQALAKLVATGCGMLEAFMRVHGEDSLPPPGAPSGETGQ